MANTPVAPTGSLNALTIKSDSELYLAPETQATFDAADFIPSTQGDIGIKQSREVQNVNLNDGTILSYPSASKSADSLSVSVYLNAGNAKLDMIRDAFDNATLMKANTFYRDGSGNAFLCYVTNFEPLSNESEFYYSMTIAPQQVEYIAPPA